MPSISEFLNEDEMTEDQFQPDDSIAKKATHSKSDFYGDLDLNELKKEYKKIRRNKRALASKARELAIKLRQMRMIMKQKEMEQNLEDEALFGDY